MTKERRGSYLFHDETNRHPIKPAAITRPYKIPTILCTEKDLTTFGFKNIDVPQESISFYDICAKEMIFGHDKKRSLYA